MVRIGAIALLACAVCHDAVPKAAAVPQSDALIAWVKQNAVALRTVEPGGDDSDLQTLGALIPSTVRVIGFGEGQHERHELLAMRNRLFRFLVEHRGVTAFAAETPYTESTLVDDYVTGRAGLSDAVVHAAFVHSSRGLEENFELLEWMRRHNSRATTHRPVRFYGVDISGNGAVDAALDYLERVDSAEGEMLEKRLMRMRNGCGIDCYRSLTADERDAVAIALSDLVSLFSDQHVVWVKRTSALEYHRAYRSAVQARQLDAGARAMFSGRYETLRLRDPAMAENLLWALEREGPQGRIFIFAHDNHLDKGVETLAGSHLSEVLGNDFMLIGSFDPSLQGREFYPSLVGLLATAGMPLFFLDTIGMPELTKGPGDAESHRQRHSTYPQWQVHESYDALVFVGSTHPARPWSAR